MRLLAPSLCAWLACLALPCVVHAQDEQSRYYLELTPGFADHADSQGFTKDIRFDNGYTLSAIVGRHLDWPRSERVDFSVELEAFYADNKIKSDGLLAAGSSTLDDLTTAAVLVNGNFGWHWSPSIDLYLVGGFGYAPSIELGTLDDGPPGPGGNPRSFDLVDEDGFAWQGKLGLRFHLGEERNYSVSIGGRYFQTEDLTVEDQQLPGSFDLENTVLGLELGFRWGI